MIFKSKCKCGAQKSLPFSGKDAESVGVKETPPLNRHSSFRHHNGGVAGSAIYNASTSGAGSGTKSRSAAAREPHYGPAAGGGGGCSLGGGDNDACLPAGPGGGNGVSSCIVISPSSAAKGGGGELGAHFQNCAIHGLIQQHQDNFVMASQSNRFGCFR